jgi:hypothetical protein
LSGIWDGYFCTPLNSSYKYNAKVAHLVEHDLAKVGVAGSSPVFRSGPVPPVADGLFFGKFPIGQALVVELVDTQDLKSCSPQRECGFNSRLGHLIFNQLERLTSVGLFDF